VPAEAERLSPTSASLKDSEPPSGPMSWAEELPADSVPVVVAPVLFVEIRTVGSFVPVMVSVRVELDWAPEPSAIRS
jgi:hypothetical protein